MKRLTNCLLTTLIAITILLTGLKALAEPVIMEPEPPGYTLVNDNLHQIDGPAPSTENISDFRLYRSAAPSRESFAKWCSVYGVERVIVMDGSARSHEFKYQSEGICPNIKVIYNVNQPLSPVSDGFLKWFDAQVEAAKKDKVGLLIRCKTGSHRTGRLAAYYQMKYQQKSLNEVLTIMDRQGKMMEFFNLIFAPQVRAMYDYLNGKPCSQPGSCVIPGSLLVPKQQ
jgi:hypothetical protein